MIWFTGDTHFWHDSEWVRTLRPFDSVEHMNETMIANWNQCVSRGDLVYCLGDFCWVNREKYVQDLLSRLSGQKILIAGNHDWKKVRTAKGWASVHKLRTIKADGHKITLCHYPMREWPASRHGSWHLHAHSHGRLSEQGLSADVGVDVRGYAPVSLTEIEAELGARHEQATDSR